MIDLDLEKFFDRVNHDKLMGQIAKRVEDKRLRKLIRAFLNAGVMENGLVAVYGPVRTVVWQGSAGDCGPYADLTGKPETDRLETKTGDPDS